MKMGRSLAFASAAVILTGAVHAAEVVPASVTFDENKVDMSLTGQPGDAKAGEETFVSRKLGNCLACHEVSALKAELFHGNVGPSLDGAADRWSPAELRAIVVDSKKVFGPDTVMPGFYSLNVGINVRKDLVGQTILTAQQVEDVVAFLETLKQ